MSKMMSKIKSYHYTECGLDNIYLQELVESNDEGDIMITVPIRELHEHIAKSIIDKANRINGKEIRFLRTEMELTHEALAEKLKVRGSDLVKWEQGEGKMKDATDRELRILMFASLVNEKPPAMIDSESDPEKITFQVEGDGCRWVLRHPVA